MVFSKDLKGNPRFVDGVGNFEYEFLNLYIYNDRFNDDIRCLLIQVIVENLRKYESTVC